MPPDPRPPSSAGPSAAPGTPLLGDVPVAFRGGVLELAGLPLTEAAERLGTPSYLYSAPEIVRRYREVDSAFAGMPHLVCYAVKACSSLGVLALLAKEGAGADIVSLGEMERAVRAGIARERIVFSGVGKTDEEMEAAIRHGIRLLNVESIPELERLEEVGRRLGQKVPIAIRVNPDVDAHTHAYVATGKKENKFGVPLEDAERAYRRAAASDHLVPRGIASHIGSQILDPGPYEQAAKALLGLVDRLAADGIRLREIDLGGGFGIRYTDESPMPMRALADRIGALLDGRDLALVLEPGRYLVAPAGLLLTRVLYVKETKTKNFVIVDAAMNDLIRPSLYGSHHEIVPVNGDGGPGGTFVADVVGPVCESGDFLAEHRTMPRVKAGDLLAVLNAGAYGMTMASNYNSRPRPPEALVAGGDLRVIRKRETLEDLLAGETT